MKETIQKHSKNNTKHSTNNTRHSTNNTRHSTNNTRHSKYKYTCYQNTNTVIKHPHITKPTRDKKS